jgi:hypothetical protein
VTADWRSADVLARSDDPSFDRLRPDASVVAATLALPRVITAAEEPCRNCGRAAAVRRGRCRSCANLVGAPPRHRAADVSDRRTQRPRDGIPTPEAIRGTCRELFLALARLSDAYAEGYELALSRTSTGIVQTGGRGWSTFESNDPTGETAVVAWEPRHVRGAVRFIAKAIGRALLEVERADARLYEAVLDLDPDLRWRRLSKREAATQDVDGNGATRKGDTSNEVAPLQSGP